MDAYDASPPRARASDPETSHEAAGSIGTFIEEHHGAIVSALTQSSEPLAAEQIADAIGGTMNHVRVGKRMSELERMAMVMQTNLRHVNRSGRKAIKYELVVPTTLALQAG